MGGGEDTRMHCSPAAAGTIRNGGMRERDGDQKHADPTVPNRMIEAVDSHQ